MTDNKDNGKLELHQVFAQANTIAGYRYLDLTGVIMNKIGDFYNYSAVDLAGSILRNPRDDKDPYSIRFASDRIWLHYAPVDSLKYIIDTAPEWIMNLAKEMEVARFSRLGLRSHFFKPCEDIVKAVTSLSRKASGSIFQDIITEVDDPLDIAFSYVTRIPVKQYIASIGVTVLQVNRAPINPFDFPSDGLVFDVDIYRRRKPPEGLHRSELPKFFKTASDITYELLEKIGYRLMEV